MLFIFLISLKSKVRLLQDSWMGQTSVGRLHGRLDVLQTSFPPSPSWIQDGGAGNDVIQDLGRVFRSPLRSEEENGGPSASGRHLGWPHLWEPEMRSSKMAAGSGRAAIFLLTPQWGSKNAPYTTYITMFDISFVFRIKRIYWGGYRHTARREVCAGPSNLEPTGWGTSWVYSHNKIPLNGFIHDYTKTTSGILSSISIFWSSLILHERRIKSIPVTTDWLISNPILHVMLKFIHKRIWLLTRYIVPRHCRNITNDIIPVYRSPL